MLDFTSALYLGLRHPSQSLPPWSQLTKGMPAALSRPPGAQRVAEKLAALQGCERATLGTSTLHLFWDLFGLWPAEGIVIYLDEGAYPIACWGVERAAGRCIPVRRFHHYDYEALLKWLKQDALYGWRPLIITDGFCPGCGRSAPLGEYLKCVRRYGGYLIVDDTQALGIFGDRLDSEMPYGLGGGGSLAWQKVSGPEVVVISSLAKGFGVPVAVLSGNKSLVQWFEKKSQTRVHCSPPSVAVIHAAEHALLVNEIDGDLLRLHLAQLVNYFRNRLADIGLSVTGGMFPVQTLCLPSPFEASVLYKRLLQHEVRTVLHCRRNGTGPRLSFLITSLHSLCDIDQATEAIAQARRGLTTKQKKLEV